MLMEDITTFDWTDRWRLEYRRVSPIPARRHLETTVSPTAVPTRITIDFRDALHPSRSWILGLDAELDGRVELIAFGSRPETRPDRVALPPLTQRRSSPPSASSLSSASSADCACPDFCERDHANE